jgi:hypothetical protein
MNETMSIESIYVDEEDPNGLLKAIAMSLTKAVIYNNSSGSDAEESVLADSLATILLYAPQSDEFSHQLNQVIHTPSSLFLFSGSNPHF